MLNASKHPSDELLVAYLEACLEPAEHHVVADHVRACDRCVELLAVVQRRLAVDAEVDAAIPAAVRLRAAGLGVVPAAPLPVAESLWARIQRRLAPMFELPILAPSSFAFGVLLMLGVLRFQPGTVPSETMMRSLPADRVAIVAVEGTQVRSSPDAAAAIVSRLARGQRVEIEATKEEWVQVSLGDGSMGWVERHSLE